MSAPLQASPSLALAAVDVERIRRGGFKEFVRRAWPATEPSRLRWNWHHEAIAEHLEAVARGEVRRLVINVPPGFSKSRVCSVLFPAWRWTLDPSHRFINASYADHVVLRDARACRTLVDTRWWQERWPHVRIPGGAAASKAAGYYETSAKGFRFSVTVRGSVTGEHADTQIIDDPIDPLGAAMASGSELDAVLEWWNGTMSSRFREPDKGAAILVMQRLHERDLAAELKRQGATVLCLPMRYEARHPDRYARDPRTTEGELLHEDRFPEPEVKRLETQLGPNGTASQLQQRPAPKGGNIFRAEWMRRFWVDLPPRLDDITMSVDCAFKGKDSSDPVALQVWGRSGPDFYLLDRRAERMSFTATLAAIEAMARKWPRCGRKLVESKANGDSVVDTLRTKLSGLLLVDPGSDSKEGRAHATTWLWAAGNVLLPHPERAVFPDGSRGAVWLRGGEPDFAREAREGSYEHALTGFPKAAHDDDVDATTQYLNHASPSFLSRLRAAFAPQNGQPPT